MNLSCENIKSNKTLMKTMFKAIFFSFLITSLLMHVFLLYTVYIDEKIFDGNSFKDTEKKFFSNKDDYAYLLKPNDSFCGNDYGKALYLIAFSTISPDEFAFRELIRETWANYTIYRKMRFYFRQY